MVKRGTFQQELLRSFVAARQFVQMDGQGNSARLTTTAAVAVLMAFSKQFGRVRLGPLPLKLRCPLRRKESNISIIWNVKVLLLEILEMISAK